MQPAQLSLLAEQVAALPTDLLAQLPEPQVAAAVSELARLIANALTTAVVGEVGDE